MTRTNNTLRSSLLAAFASTWLAACGGGGSATPGPTSDAGALPVAAGSPAPAPSPSGAPAPSAAPSASGPAPAPATSPAPSPAPLPSASPPASGPVPAPATSPAPSPTPSPEPTPFRAFAPEAIAQNANVPIPQVARLRGGGSVVVWGSGPALMAQRADSSGAVVGSPIALGAASSQDIPYASVAATADGGFVVAVVVADSVPASDQDTVQAVQVRRFSADGTLQFDVRVNDGHFNGVGSTPVIRAAADGGFVVAWIARSAYKGPVAAYLQRLGPDGSRRGSPVAMATLPLVAQLTPVLLADGSLLALSLQLDDGPASDQRWAIHAQRFGADLTPLSGDTRLDVWTQVENFPFDAARLANGNVALAWVANAGPGVYRIQSTVLSTAGTPVAGIDSYEWPFSIWQVDHVGVAALGDGFGVAWEALEGYNRGTVGELWFQRHTADGATAEAPVKLTGLSTLSVSPTTGASSHAWPGFTIDGGADGHFVAGFQSIPATVYLMGQ